MPLWPAGVRRGPRQSRLLDLKRPASRPSLSFGDFERGRFDRRARRLAADLAQAEMIGLALREHHEGLVSVRLRLVEATLPC